MYAWYFFHTDQQTLLELHESRVHKPAWRKRNPRDVPWPLRDLWVRSKLDVSTPECTGEHRCAHLLWGAVYKLICVGTLESTVEGDLASWIYLPDLWSSFSFFPAPVASQLHRVNLHCTMLMAQACFPTEVSLLAPNHWHSPFNSSK